MSNNTEDRPFASFEAMLAKSAIEFDRKLEQSREEFQRDIKLSREEFQREMKESRASFKKEMEESRAERNQRMKELDASIDKTRAEHNQRMKDLERHVGGLANNHGDFAEEYFFNSFENGQSNFFGEEFDFVERRKTRRFKKGLGDEYDIMLVNCKAIGLIEIKFRAHIDDIPKVINKVRTFRANFPEYSKHKVYLGLATMVFDSKVEKECVTQGIAVIKQVGDKVIIYDENLKTF